MRETICLYPSIFRTLVPAPVDFCRHEKESMSSAVSVHFISCARAVLNSSHDSCVKSSHGPCCAYSSFAFFPVFFLGISTNSAYLFVSSFGALFRPFRLLGITSCDGEEVGDGEQRMCFDDEVDIRSRLRGGLDGNEGLDNTSIVLCTF